MELQGVVSPHVGAGSQPQVLCNNSLSTESFGQADCCFKLSLEAKCHSGPDWPGSQQSSQPRLPHEETTGMSHCAD